MDDAVITGAPQGCQSLENKFVLKVFSQSSFHLTSVSAGTLGLADCTDTRDTVLPSGYAFSLCTEHKILHLDCDIDQFMSSNTLPCSIPVCPLAEFYTDASISVTELFDLVTVGRHNIYCEHKAISRSIINCNTLNEDLADAGSGQNGLAACAALPADKENGLTEGSM